MKSTKKLIAVILSVIMIISVMPISIFVEAQSPTGDYYEKITSTSQMESGARYLIVCENYCYALDGSLGEDMDSAYNYIEVDIDFHSFRIAATEELDAAAFYIDASEGTIKSVSGYYIGSADSQNKLLTSTTSDFVNEIGFDDGDFEAGHQGTANHYMLHFSNEGYRFRYYKNDWQMFVQLYKRVDAPANYVNASGEAQEPISDYTTLTESVAEWTNGWYVLKNNITYGGRVDVKGDNVNLILCDGATMSVKDGVLIREGYALTIWAQENGTGKLVATGNRRENQESAGIGSSPECGGRWVDHVTYINYNAGDVTINGGVIEAKGGYHCAGIGGSPLRSSGTVTINGGNVTATGGEGAAGINGGYGESATETVINGGAVTATGGASGAGIGGGANGHGGNITINDGIVTATGGSNAAAIGGGLKGGCGDILITGGNIQAQGGSCGGGIGAGCKGEYDNIRVRFHGGIVNAVNGDGNEAAVGGLGATIRFDYTEPGYDMRITAKNYKGMSTIHFDKPFISVGLKKVRTYNGRVATSVPSGTVIPKTAGAWNVTFDKNGGTGNMETQEVIGGTYTLPECDFTAPSEEQPFVCWKVKVGDNKAVQKQPGETVLVNADTTITAIWKTDYTVSFDNGGGSGTMQDATVTAYDTYTLPENAFTAPAGKTFSEWRVTQDSYSEMLQPGDKVVIGADTTVTAIWTSAITSWAALHEAIGNAANGDTIYLGQNLTAVSGDTELTVSGKSVTLDLNGCTLDRNLDSAASNGSVFKIHAGAGLTLTDTSKSGSGKITGGYANNGGAIYNDGTLVIEGVVITDNHTNHENNYHRGGAIYNNGTFTMTGGTISANDGDDAGAIYNTAGGTVSLSKVTLSGNASVNHGGGAIVNNGALTLQKCTLADNTAKSDGGAIWTNAGNGAVTITNTAIRNNTTANTDTHGGAIYISSGSVAVTGGTIADNTAKDGGAVYNSADGTLTMENVSIHSNRSTQSGGGAVVNYGAATLTDCDVWGNSAKTNGGAIWSGGSDSASLTVTNCDISSNSCEQTGGGICLRQGVLNTSGITLSNNTSADGGGLTVCEGATANLGGDGTVIYGNESTTHGGGITNNGTIRATTTLLVEYNHSVQTGGGIYNANNLSVQDIVTIQNNNSDNLGDNLYLTDGKVVTLTNSLLAAAIGVEAENPNQFITSGWYENHHSANPESYFKALSYYTVYMPDGETELKLKKTDDFPYSDTATIWASDSNGINYRTGTIYSVHNLSSGTKVNFLESGTPVTRYGTSGGVTRSSFQSSSNNNITGVSYGTLEIDRSKLDKVEQTGMYIEFQSLIHTQVGGVRWGVELFPYSENAPENLGSLGNTVGKTVTLKGTNDNDYTYQLHYDSVDGALRCAQTADGDFTSEATVATGVDKTYGPYYWYITGGAPAAGESVTLRIAAICCSRESASNLQMLSEWTDIEIIGTCSHSNGHLKAHSANAPTCTQEGNSAYWKCDICGKCFSDAQAENEIEEGSWIIEPTGHHYSQAEWMWAEDYTTAIAIFNCDNCEHSETVEAQVSSSVESGVRVYVATAEFKGETYTDSKTAELPAKNGANLTLEGNIEEAIYIDAAAYELGEGAVIKVTANANTNISETPDFETTTYKVKDLTPFVDPEGKYTDTYKFAFKNAPAQITEDVTVALYASENEAIPVKTITYSVKDYCDTVIAESNNAKLVALCKAILDYGRAAQLEFNYNTEHMAVDEYYNAAAIEALTYSDISGTTLTDTLGVTGCAFQCLANTNINLYIDNPLTSADIQASLEGENESAIRADYMRSTKTGRLFISVSGIAAGDMTKNFTVVTSNGTVTTNLNTIVKTCLYYDNASTLAKTIYFYANAADAYFN